MPQKSKITEHTLYTILDTGCGNEGACRKRTSTETTCNVPSYVCTEARSLLILGETSLDLQRGSLRLLMATGAFDRPRNTPKYSHIFHYNTADLSGDRPLHFCRPFIFLTCIFRSLGRIDPQDFA